MKCDNRATILVLPEILDRGRNFFVACDSCWAKLARSGAFRGTETVPLSAYPNFVGMPDAFCGDGDGVDREDGRNWPPSRTTT